MPNAAGIAELRRENALLADGLQSLQADYAALKETAASLRDQLDWFKRQLFGRRSEKRLEFDLTEQADLFRGARRRRRARHSRGSHRDDQLPAPQEGPRRRGERVEPALRRHGSGDHRRGSGSGGGVDPGVGAGGGRREGHAPAGAASGELRGAALRAAGGEAAGHRRAGNPNEALGEDARFKSYGLAPKSAADFSFLLHGFHYLKDDGVMAIILPHGVLFRGGAEAKIRRKLLDDGHIDTVIGLPSNLFYSTGIPVCILVLKKCKKPDDVLFINASEYFEKGKRQNHLSDEHIGKILDTYRERPESIERYARRVEMDEIEANDFNLNISRYVSTAEPEVAIDLSATHTELVDIEKQIQESTVKHNTFLGELGLSSLPVRRHPAHQREPRPRHRAPRGRR